MSFITDTIRDSRRPMPGGVARHASDTPATHGTQTQSMPMAEAMRAGTADRRISQVGVPGRTHGHSDFRKEEPQALREAPFQSGGGGMRLPAGDPLSAGADVERPKSLATNVGITDISFKGDNRESELETGQEERGSPGKVAAANVKSGSKTHQSVVLSGPIEAESIRETHQSTTPEGSERLVSRRGETYLSRLPGRGAPSESPLAVTLPASRRPRGANAGRREVGISAVEPESSRAAKAEPALQAARPDAADLAGAGHAAPVAKAARAGKGEFAAALPEPPRESPSFSQVSPISPVHAAAPASSRTAEREPPSLVIGRIDVVVLASDAPVEPRPSLHPGNEFLSRNYLKRL